jgi:carotenoid cleavage dioxygenase-like enzyme
MLKKKAHIVLTLAALGAGVRTDASSPRTIPTSLTSAQGAFRTLDKAEHREIAREMWQRIALSEPIERNERWRVRDRARLLDTPNAAAKLDEFCKLRGTYYCNGLASCRVGDKLVHPFEAHGYGKALSLDGDGGASFRARVVDTPCSLSERRQGRVTSRGVMSDALGWPLKMIVPPERDTANIAMRSWPHPSLRGEAGACAPVIIAAADNGTPYALDPTSLETIGRLCDVVDGAGALAGKRLLAHTRFDAARGRLVLIASDIKVDPLNGCANSVIDVWELDASGAIASHCSHKCGFVVAHDFAITENYYVVPANAARLLWGKLASYLFGFARGVEVFNLAVDQPGAVLLIPRPDGDASAREPMLCAAGAYCNIFHFGPAYERDAAGGGRELVLTAMATHTYAFGGEMGFDAVRNEFDPIGWSAGDANPAPRLERFVVDLATGALSRDHLPALIVPPEGGPPVDVPFDMPTHHPLRDGVEARYCYAAGAARIEGWFPFNSIVKLDLHASPVGVHAWWAPERAMTSEPMFLPRGKGGTQWLGAAHEDDGFVISLVHDSGGAGRCELFVWDAKQFEQGPFAAIDLGELFPWDVHATWVPGEYLGGP